MTEYSDTYSGVVLGTQVVVGRGLHAMHGMKAAVHDAGQRGEGHEVLGKRLCQGRERHCAGLMCCSAG